MPDLTPGAPALPPPFADALDATLDEGEALRWTGAPERLPTPSAVLLRAMVSLGVLLALAPFLMGGLRSAALPLWAVTSALAAVASAGAAWTMGEARRQRATRYAITDRRALVLRPKGDGVDVDEVPAWSLAGRRKQVRYDGRGTVTFAASTGERALAFHHLPNVRAVDALLGDLPEPAQDALAAAPADASLVPTPVLRALAGVLDEGEAVRWWGHPDVAALKNHRHNQTGRGHTLDAQRWMVPLFAVIAFMVAGMMVWQWQTDHTAPFQLLPSLTGMGVALAMHRKMRQRLYVVTDRRALIVTPGKGRTFTAKSFGPAQVAARTRAGSKFGRATLRFDGKTDLATSLDEDAFIGPQPAPLVERLLDALAEAPEPTRPQVARRGPRGRPLGAATTAGAAARRPAHARPRRAHLRRARAPHPQDPRLTPAPPHAAFAA